MELFPGGGGGCVVGGNEIKATQPNLAWAWPELGNSGSEYSLTFFILFLNHKCLDLLFFTTNLNSSIFDQNFCLVRTYFKTEIFCYLNFFDTKYFK